MASIEIDEEKKINQRAELDQRNLVGNFRNIFVSLCIRCLLSIGQYRCQAIPMGADSDPVYPLVLLVVDSRPHRHRLGR